MPARSCGGCVALRCGAFRVALRVPLRVTLRVALSPLSLLLLFLYSLVARRRSSFVVVPRRSSLVGRRRPSFKNCSRIASASFQNGEDFALWIDVGPEVVWSTRECISTHT